MRKKLHIGIMGTRGIPNHYGGFEQFAACLAEGLTKRGHSVWVYNSNRHPYQEKEWKGVQLVHCKDPEHRIGTAGQFLYDLHCINDARKRSFDALIHLGYTSDSIWHRRWPKGVRHIVNMDGLEWKRSKYGRITQWFLQKAEALAARNADLLVADSTVIEQYLKDRYNTAVQFIPYAANIFNEPDPDSLHPWKIRAGQYYLLISRMVPENNVETIIRGYLLSGQTLPLLVIGDTRGKYGQYIRSAYQSPGLIYTGSLYDLRQLNNLRYHAKAYFHGHSVGGTNPSLLEAMACGTALIAHDNAFNRSVLDEDAEYFFSEEQISEILKKERTAAQQEQRKAANLEKIRKYYSEEKIIGAYEDILYAE